MASVRVPSPDEAEFRRRMQRVESLVDEVERGADAAVRERTREIVRTLLDLHAAALDRMLERVAATGEGGLAVIEGMAGDPVIAGLLLLHGLHPADLETRVRQALDQVRPYLHSHGGNVELLGIDGAGVVRLRMQGSCHGCPSSAVTLKTAIEEAIYERAPDVAGIEVEGVTAAGGQDGGVSQAPVGFVPVEQLYGSRKAKAAV